MLTPRLIMGSSVIWIPMFSLFPGSFVTFIEAKVHENAKQAAVSSDCFHFFEVSHHGPHHKYLPSPSHGDAVHQLWTDGIVAAFVDSRPSVRPWTHQGDVLVLSARD